jgi:hypothetical protein
MLEDFITIWRQGFNSAQVHGKKKKKNRSETANKKGYPIDNIKILIFDEIFMMSNPAINRIKQKLFEMEKRPEIIAIIIRDDMQ